MNVIRTVRYTVEPESADAMLERRRALLGAVRAACSGPEEARLVRLDEQTWLDIWRWDSRDTLARAVEAVHRLPEAGAAFELTANLTSEQGDLVAEDSWPT